MIISLSCSNLQHVRHIFYSMENFTIRQTMQLQDLLQHQFQPIFSWDIMKNSELETFRGLHHPTIEVMSKIFFQFLIIALKKSNFLIISIQDTLKLSLSWRLKLIKSFLLQMFLLTIAKIFSKVLLIINPHILACSLITLVLHLAFTKQVS